MLQVLLANPRDCTALIALGFILRQLSEVGKDCAVQCLRVAMAAQCTDAYTWEVFNTLSNLLRHNKRYDEVCTPLLNSTCAYAH